MEAERYLLVLGPDRRVVARLRVGRGALALVDAAETLRAPLEAAVRAIGSGPVSARRQERRAGLSGPVSVSSLVPVDPSSPDWLAAVATRLEAEPALRGHAVVAWSGGGDEGA